MSKMVVMGAIALSLCGWLTMMAGVASMTDEIDSLEGSTKQLGLIWWATWFEFFVLLVMLYIALTGKKGLAQARSTMLGMVTTIMMVTANQANSLIGLSSGKFNSGCQANLAGTIICMFLNFILILWQSGEIDEVAQMVTGKPGPAPVTYASAPPPAQVV